MHIPMGPQKPITSKFARRLYLQIAQNNIQIEMQKQELRRLKRLKRKLEVLHICHEFEKVMTELRHVASTFVTDTHA